MRMLLHYAGQAFGNFHPKAPKPSQEVKVREAEPSVL